MPKSSDVFGELTFNRKVMREKLNKSTYQGLLAIMHSGEPLTDEIAQDVAQAVKEWAMEKGATHFTHWFQPQRGGTAEKHDAFISYDENDEIIEHFSAMQLIQSEPDASSFPSGGIRSTFEARGYTAWDPTSPIFLLEAEDTRTLVIPSVYLSWTGEVLDIKTPFLRSLRALNDAALGLQRQLGNRFARRISLLAGPEQEYFIIPKELYRTRPDLRICGRTLFGAPPAKGQQMEDHYFGTIHPKVIRFMEDLDLQLYRRGIPAKTRHNEVAPNQFEVAVLHEEVNRAIDHNLQLMDILKIVADTHGFVALLHEKPLAGVNGSGKHLNFSVCDNTGSNYLEPSASPLKNISFLMTIGAILLGVNKFGGLLRASIADAGNDHRLGANEAPPAIMSVYLGEYLNALLSEIEGIGKLTEQKMAGINMGVRNLPRIAKDYSDRNRTSPIAFTGNKIEFRAVGSSQNCAEAATIINLLLAYGYYIITKRIKARGGSADVKEKAILVLRDILKETKRIRFEGNNYSSDWHKEAAKRKLPSAPNAPAALGYFLDKDVVELFDKSKVLSERELHSKVEIKLETYVKLKEIEFKCAANIARTLILPAIARHLNDLAPAFEVVKAAGYDTQSICEEVRRFNELYGHVLTATKSLEGFLQRCCQNEDIPARAQDLAETGGELLGALRDYVDTAEEGVAAGLWPMAKYQELLTAL